MIVVAGMAAFNYGTEIKIRGHVVSMHQYDRDEVIDDGRLDKTAESWSLSVGWWIDALIVGACATTVVLFPEARLAAFLCGVVFGAGLGLLGYIDGSDGAPFVRGNTIAAGAVAIASLALAGVPAISYGLGFWRGCTTLGTQGGRHWQSR